MNRGLKEMMAGAEQHAAACDRGHGERDPQPPNGQTRLRPVRGGRGLGRIGFERGHAG